MTIRLLSKRRGLLIIIFGLLAIFAWSPWLTDSYATTAVTEKLGGPDQEYFYLGETLLVSDIPKDVVRVPFGMLVYFPGEAVYFVTFWGWVL